MLIFYLETMEDWDQATLEKVVESKKGEYNQNKPTEIVCLFFSLSLILLLLFRWRIIYPSYAFLFGCHVLGCSVTLTCLLMISSFWFFLLFRCKSSVWNMLWLPAIVFFGLSGLLVLWAEKYDAKQVSIFIYLFIFNRPCRLSLVDHLGTLTWTECDC